MSEKVEVRGDVAQLIGGNVNEAPRQNNVVNFNVGSDKGPVQALTDLQRKRIAGLVRELCAITLEETLDVYRVILTEFGAERMRDMPREKYHDVVSQLQQWIAENSQSVQKLASPPEAAMKDENLQAPGTHSQRCAACCEKDSNYARLQRSSRGQWILSTILILVCGMLLYKLQSQVDTTQLVEQHCLFEGKPYSLGSTIKNSGGLLSECSINAEQHTMLWTKTR